MESQGSKIWVKVALKWSKDSYKMKKGTLWNGVKAVVVEYFPQLNGLSAS